MDFMIKKIKIVLGFDEESFDLDNSDNLHNLDQKEGNLQDLNKAISTAKRIKEDKSISLNDRVKSIIRWYEEKYLKSLELTDSDDYYEPFKLRDFIEKVAVWYELRYPNCDLDKEMGIKDKKYYDTNRALLEDNEYVDVFFSGIDMKEFEWSNFYNTHASIRSLDSKEKIYFDKPRYPKVVIWDNMGTGIYPSVKSSLELSRTGKVIGSENMRFLCTNISDRKLIGMHIVDVVNLLHENGIKIYPSNSFVKTVQKYDLENEMRCKVLDAIMYRIIERGGEIMGPKRGFIFAKEFGRNIDVPMKYGINISDPYLGDFINSYLKSGGNKNLECLLNYFVCKGDYTKIKKVNISEVLKTRIYTDEDKELAQKLVELLASRVDYDSIRKEEAKELRLEKRLRKSKIRR